jgi:hypothetical protein
LLRHFDITLKHAHDCIQLIDGLVLHLLEEGSETSWAFCLLIFQHSGVSPLHALLVERMVASCYYYWLVLYKSCHAQHATLVQLGLPIELLLYQDLLNHILSQPRRLIALTHLWLPSLMPNYQECASGQDAQQEQRSWQQYKEETVFEEGDGLISLGIA